MKTKDAGRMLAIAVLLAAAAGACGGGSGDGATGGGAAGGGAAGGGGRGGSNGRGQTGAAVEVLPTSGFDPGPNGGADLPEPMFRIIEECYSALQARSFGVLAPRMTAVIESADPGADRGLIVAARLCRGLAHLNDGAVAEAARDLDTAEGGLGALPGDPKHQLEVLLLRGQMVANARQRRLDEAGAYLARAAALAPDQAARFQQELAASSPAATTTSPTTRPTSTGTQRDLAHRDHPAGHHGPDRLSDGQSPRDPGGDHAGGRGPGATGGLHPFDRDGRAPASSGRPRPRPGAASQPAGDGHPGAGSDHGHHGAAVLLRLGADQCVVRAAGD